MDGLVGWTTTSGGPEQVISVSEMWPLNLQVVGTDLYFIDQSWAKLKRAPIAGRPVVEVFTPPQPGGRLVQLTAFQIRSDELYWADFGASNAPGAIYRTNLTSGSTVTLAANVANIKKFVVDDTGVFWLSQSGSAAMGWTVSLWTVPHGSFVPQQLAQSVSSTGAGNFRLLATDQSAIYFDDPSSLAVNRMDKTSGTRTMLAYGFVANALHSDGTSLYWSQRDCTQMSGGSCIAWETKLKKTPTGGGPLSGTLLGAIPGPNYEANLLRVDGTCLYFNGPNKGVYKLGK